MSDVSRRRFLQAAGMLPLVAALPKGFLAEAMAATPTNFQFFTAHQAAVVREATARLIPGPQDDPNEAGHPGAREANVVRYVDMLLSAFKVSPPRIHASGPWSNRAGGKTNYMAYFLRLSPYQERLWRRRVGINQAAYIAGIKALDAAAGGDFTKATPPDQDDILVAAGDFRDLLFVHAIEGTYSAPEYGGNAGLTGWKEISFKGDTQPRGYSAAQVGTSDGLDPVTPDDLLLGVMANLDAAAIAIAARRLGGR